MSLQQRKEAGVHVQFKIKGTHLHRLREYMELCGESSLGKAARARLLPMLEGAGGLDEIAARVEAIEVPVEEIVACSVRQEIQIEALSAQVSMLEERLREDRKYLREKLG